MSIDDKKLINVKNRNNGTTSYKLPDSHISRTFSYEETKKIPFEELRELSYAPGGEYMLKELLIVEDEEALKELNISVEPEYFYSEAEIKKILFENDNMDAFLDFLDFATEGALDIAKKLAVDEQLPDSRKRKALSKKTGFNIDSAIQVNEQLAAEDDDNEVKESTEKKERRVQAEEKPATGRRTAAPAVPNYKVVDKK